jgi:hypothetical protein
MVDDTEGDVLPDSLGTVILYLPQAVFKFTGRGFGQSGVLWAQTRSGKTQGSRSQDRHSPLSILLSLGLARCSFVFLAIAALPPS